jgi:hypothetical protein
MMPRIFASSGHSSAFHPVEARPTTEYVDEVRISLARNCCEYSCFASIAREWPASRHDFARREPHIELPITSQPKYAPGNAGMASNKPKYARPKPQRQLHLLLYD